MRILFLGDVMGRSGRQAVEKHLPDLIEGLKTDVVIVNGENAAHGAGITEKICDNLLALDVDCVTTGNHIWDKREIMSYVDGQPKLLRPINYPPGTPGRGSYEHRLADGRKILFSERVVSRFLPAGTVTGSFWSLMIISQSPLLATFDSTNCKRSTNKQIIPEKTSVLSKIY